jgi:colanic acid/amylovoran biosynthesis glycosyltransferase
LSKFDYDILVISPQFPSVNQPWIETYLENLLLNSFRPAIYSNEKNLSYCSPRAERLGLFELILPMKFSLLSAAKCIAKKILVTDFQFLKNTARISIKMSIDIKSIVTGFLYVAMFESARLKKFHVIHSHDETQAYRFLYLAQLQDTPILLTFHGLPPDSVKQLNGKKRKVLYNRLNRVIVNTQFAKELVCSLGCDSSKVVIIPQGLPLEDFPFFERPAPSHGEPIRILTVGRYDPDKGQVYALLALRRLVDSNMPAKWYFVGVGKSIDNLKRWAKKLDLDNHVEFLTAPPREVLKQLYRNCHLFVLPSISHHGQTAETQGVVLQEAQSSGCIPIASRVGGIPECVHDNIDGRIVKQKSSREIAKAIIVLANTPEVWYQYQLAGRKNVEVNFSAERIGSKMASILLNVICG